MCVSVPAHRTRCAKYLMAARDLTCETHEICEFKYKQSNFILFSTT